MAKIFQKGPALKQTEQSKSGFEAKNTLRMGTKKAPAQISVQTEEREQEISAIFAKNKWFCEINVDPDQDENISDLEILKNKPVSAVNTTKASRNDPCPCESGKKYKKCCGA